MEKIVQSICKDVVNTINDDSALVWNPLRKADASSGCFIGLFLVCLQFLIYLLATVFCLLQSIGYRNAFSFFRFLRRAVLELKHFELG
ncbi:hypothetical protein T12_9781 [Trichinella patagoniensis]|uniref:Uncharacterized protein n=1 Tax=Trichinella patagoniensis TaxID=990121 RepID=A0A0V0ZU63_9BILA|nr:hypothetical protein T12_9781 [Trichinella patagoniensis]